MKKRLFIISIFLVLLSANLVLALDSSDMESFIESTLEALKSIFRPIIGGATGDEFLLVKVGFFFLTFMLVMASLRNVDIFGSNTGALFITSLIVAILSARYIPEVGIIKAMIHPYIALFTTLGLLSIPIFTVFVVHYFQFNWFFRWLILLSSLIVYGFYLFGGNYSDKVFFFKDSNAFLNWLPMIVYLGALAADKWIHGAFKSQRYAGVENEIRERTIQDQLEQLRLAEESGDDRRVRKIKRRLKRLKRRV